MLSARAGLDMDQAFTAMRGYARSHSQKLVDVAQAIVQGSLAVTTVVGAPNESN